MKAYKIPLLLTCVLGVSSVTYAASNTLTFTNRASSPLTVSCSAGCSTLFASKNIGTNAQSAVFTIPNTNSAQFQFVIGTNSTYCSIKKPRANAVNLKMGAAIFSVNTACADLLTGLKLFGYY